MKSTLLWQRYFYLFSFVFKDGFAGWKRIGFFFVGPAFDAGFVGVHFLAEAGDHNLIVAAQWASVQAQRADLIRIERRLLWFGTLLFALM